jgi:hypothetical protein
MPGRLSRAPGAVILPAMQDYNPYAPPASDLEPGPGQSSGGGAYAWRQGDLLLIHTHGGALPDRCVVCNAPANGYRLRKTFAWHPPEYYLTVLAGVLIYVIVAMFTRKTAALALGLCEQHRVRRRNALIVAWGGFALSFVLMFVGATNDSAALMLGSVVGMGVLPIVGGLMARVASVSKIDDGHAWLRVGRPFLESLPPA